MTFPAMGSSADVVVLGPSGLVDHAREMIHHFERCWSRFLPHSDISRLNAAGGAPVRVDPSTMLLVTSMIRGWRATSGRFDPTLLAPLIALGYDSSWEDPTRVTSLPAGAAWRGNPDAIAIDPAADLVRLPVGTMLDPGAIGKGLAADLVADELRACGAEGALVDIGGDIAVRGAAPHTSGWAIAIDRSDEALLLLHGGVATSGTERRRWPGGDGSPCHHVLDPARGAPLPEGRGDIAEVTLIAGTAARAEVWATAVLVAGAEAGLAGVDRAGLAARIRLGDGTVLHGERWREFATARVPA